MIFRRRPAEEPVDSGVESTDEFDELEAERPRGPWDRSETTADQDDDKYVDLGGLVIKGAEGFELRLQVDEASQLVTAVLLAGPESGLELRAFAASRTGGIWDDIRTEMAAEVSRLGGTATEVDGEFGTELKLSVPLRTPDGRSATQLSRVVGVEGPRWLLRGTFLGRSAEEADPDGGIEGCFRDVIVVRGDQAMSPREMIPMTLPLAARAAAQEQEDDDRPES
ncbi:MAG: DUF3710 domain-containing protein [Nocardioidaceae bacterium]